MGDRYPANPDEFQKWQDNTIEFLQNKFGKENVINAVLHMDESSPLQCVRIKIMRIR